MYVFCVGMYRAGSTWQYEVVSHLIEHHRQGSRLGFVRGCRLAAIVREKGVVRDGWYSLKAHEGHKRFVNALDRGRGRAVYCYRDLRDVAFSLAHVYRTSFEDIVQQQKYLKRCITNDRFWTRQPGILCQRYEEMVADPPRAVQELADHLDLDLCSGEAETVAELFSMEANRERAAEWEKQVRANGIDPDNPVHGLLPEAHTLLHWNHIREGRVGGWRSQATVAQRATLALLCGAWLRARGYEKDDTWALECLEGFGRVEEEWLALRRERADQMERVVRADIAAERLEALDRLGPVALRLATEFHALSLRFPRLRAFLKKVLSLSRGRPMLHAGATPEWAS